VERETSAQALSPSARRERDESTPRGDGRDPRALLKRRSFLAAGASLAVASTSLAGCASLRTPGALAFGTPVAEPRPEQPSTISGKILYVKRGDLWIYSAGQQKQLTTGLRYDGPAWSPDGASIAVSVVGENHSDLVVLTSSGARVRQLTHNLSNVSVENQAWARKPCWSPSGQQIAYVTDLGYVDMSLTVIPSGGGTAHKVVVHQIGGGGTDWPSWEPDGTHIAYADFSERQSRLFLYNVDNTTYGPLADFADGAFDPAWSPDGRWMAFTGRDAKQSDVYVMHADGTSPVRVTENGASRAPTWSPDGEMLAFIIASNGALDIAVTRLSLGAAVSASTPRQLTSGEPIDGPSGLSWTG
jgi:TolB protein